MESRSSRPLSPRRGNEARNTSSAATQSFSVIFVGSADLGISRRSINQTNNLGNPTHVTRGNLSTSPSVHLHVRRPEECGTRVIHGEPRLAAVKPPLPPCNAADTQFKQLSFAQIVDLPRIARLSPHILHWAARVPSLPRSRKKPLAAVCSAEGLAISASTCRLAASARSL